MEEFKRRKTDNESLPVKVSPTLLWILGIVFAAGIAYTSILKIPTIEREQACQDLKINTLEANYATIKDFMDRNDRRWESIQRNRGR